MPDERWESVLNMDGEWSQLLRAHRTQYDWCSEIRGAWQMFLSRPPARSGLYGSHSNVHHPECGPIWQETTRHSATCVWLRGNDDEAIAIRGQEMMVEGAANSLASLTARNIPSAPLSLRSPKPPEVCNRAQAYTNLELRHAIGSTALGGAGSFIFRLRHVSIIHRGWEPSRLARSRERGGRDPHRAHVPFQYPFAG